MHKYKPRSQFNGRELLMAPPKHRIVELVGGPLDGKLLKEVEGSPAFSTKATERYCISGAEYRPDRVDGHVLKMVYTGRCYS